VDDLVSRLDAAAGYRLREAEQRVGALCARLASLSPDAVIKRGYAIVRERQAGQVVTSIAQVDSGLPLSIQVRDGTIAARVEASTGDPTG
jgi:exodeoxyribonuclease VII large subunit